MTQKNVKLQAGLPAIGTQVDGRYELLGLLGRGGFGAVYLARQISMDRDVALKILLTQALNMDEMVQRFKREVMAIRNLSHPNTIQIYDFSKSDAGFLYYAMEAVKGPTLKHVIKDEGPIAPIRVRHICRQILKSLSEAHASRIVHRDLKPANIMLAQMHGEVDFVKVLDFGIAKLLDADDGEEELTNAGVLIGTISYMSPEQIGSQNIDATTDIYALGLIGIEMLYGQSVFAKSGKWEILNKQISSDPIEIPDFVKNDPVGRIFVKAVSKIQADRFQSAIEMIRAFEQIADCSRTPLVQKGWGKSVRSGIKTSSISQSGPISVSSQIMPNTPSQPIPISLEDLEEIPMMTSSNLVLESNSQIISHQSASFSSDTNSAFHTISAKKNTNTPIIIGLIAALIFGLVGVFFFLQPKEPKLSAEHPVEKEVVKPLVKEPIKAPSIEKEEIEKPLVKKIQLSGPQNAVVFDETDVRIGALPFEVSVSEPTTFKIKAKGFVQKNLVISPSSSTEIVVNMEREKQKSSKKNTEIKKNGKEKITEKSDAAKKLDKKRRNEAKQAEVRRKADAKKKPAAKKKKEAGWVPVKKKEKVKAWD